MISIMIGSVTERLAPDSNFVVNGTNGTGSVNTAARDEYRVQIACSLTLLTGIFQVSLCVHIDHTENSRGGKLCKVLNSLITPLLTSSPCLLSDSAGCGEVWFRGHLPV